MAHPASVADANAPGGVSKGYKAVAHMKKDTDLDPLRQRDDFRKLVADLEGKGK